MVFLGSDQTRSLPFFFSIMTVATQTEQRFIFKGYNRHAFYQELNCFAPTYESAWSKFAYMHPNFMILTVDCLGDWED